MTYVYQILNADGSEGGVFEVEQSAGDPPLRVHPRTGVPVRLVHQPPHLAGQHHERHVRAQLSDTEKLSQLGFTRYEKDRVTGRYQKIRGKR
jgi:hypothetical protein